MKTIGILGGMSWQSTVIYYQLINQMTQQERKGTHCAPILLHSLDFAHIADLQQKNDWQQMTRILSSSGKALAGAGAHFLLIATNTMHRIAKEVEQLAGIPLLHIADATAQVATTRGFFKLGLLGTQFTMEQPFYKNHLAEYGLTVITPNAQDRALVHQVIYEQLCVGDIRPSSKSQYLRIIADLARQGAQAIVLGCTEIGLLIQQADTAIALLDTTAIHAQAAVRYALD